MIKSFNEYINEDYFSKLASRKDNGNVRKENEITEEFVRSFVNRDSEKQIKSITIRKESGKTIVDIDGNFIMKISIEDIPFQFGKVTGDFYCTICKLKSLDGCPKEVGGDFSCAYCENLKSLDGCPKEVGGDFSCHHCEELTSLKGCPKEVGGGFYCNECAKLKSLNGCPKEVGGDFVCWDCDKQFTKDEVKSLCNVKGSVMNV